MSKAKKGRQVAKVVELRKQENKLSDLAKGWSDINKQANQNKTCSGSKPKQTKYILQLHPAYRGSDKT
jgi:hypothetical protein